MDKDKSQKRLEKLKRIQEIKSLGADKDAALLLEAEELNEKMDVFGELDLRELSNLKKIKGEQGEKGDKGDKGERGDDGKDGVDGKDGKDGKDGRDGLDGLDADEEYILERLIKEIPENEELRLDTREELRDKLESFTDEDEKLNQSAISGLEKKLKKLEKDVKNNNGTTIFGGGNKIKVQEEDGSPVKTTGVLKFSNGSLTVNADGSVSIASGGGSVEGTAVLSTGETGGTKFLREDGDGTSSWQTISGGGDALVANPLSQFASTTSAQFAGVISDETGTGSVVLATSPTLVTPDLGTPSALVGTNITGTAAGLTVGATTGVEAGADVTDTANVTAAGALMDSEVTNLAQVKAFSSADYATAAQGSLADSSLQNVVEDTTPQLGGGLDVNGQEITGAIDLHSTGDIINELGDAVGTNKLSVRDSAAVEVAAIDSDGNITTSGTVDGRDIATDGTKLDGIETSADVTDTTNVTAAGALMDSELTDIAAVKSLSDASIADTDTGTSTTAFVTPDGLHGSTRNVRWLAFNLVEAGTDCAVATNVGGDFLSPIAGTILQSDSAPFYIYATNSTAGTTGTMVVDVNIGGTSIMTTNKIDIDTAEKTSTTGATQPDLTTTTLAVGDIITIDVDAIHTTAAKGLTVYMAVRED